jgi:hypothetical protein
MIVNFLKTPARDIIRIDCQYTPKAVLMQYWMHEIFYGAGEPHRGYVCNLTRKVTTRVGEWEGGTTQIVRYDWGGMGMLVRYPVNAMLADGFRDKAEGHEPVIGSEDELVSKPLESSRKGTNTRYTFDTKNKTISKTEINFKTSPVALDRSRFVDIKVYVVRRYDRLPIPTDEILSSRPTRQGRLWSA